MATYRDVILAQGADQLDFIPSGAFAGRAYTIPLNSFKGAGSVQLQGGVNIQPLSGDPRGRITVSFGLVCGGATGDAAIANWQAVEKKLEQARRGSASLGISTAVNLQLRQVGSSNFAYYDLMDGHYAPQDMGQIGAAVYLGGTLSLICMPTARGGTTAIAVSGTLANGVDHMYLSSVVGDAEALANLAITDVSTNGKIIQQIRLYRRSFFGLQDGGMFLPPDFKPVYYPTSSSPGADHADATALNGSASRITASTSWQTICKVGSGTGSYNNGLFNIWGRVKSSAAPIGQPVATVPSTTLSGGELPSGDWNYIAVPLDGSSNKGTPSGVMPVTVVGAVAGASTLFGESFETNNLNNWAISNAFSGTVATSGTAPLSGTYSLILTSPATANGVSVNRPTPALPASKYFSVQALFKATQYNGNAATTNLMLLGNWAVVVNGSTGAIQIQSPAGALVQGTSTLNAGTQYTIELLYDGSGQIGSVSLYVGGTFVAKSYDDATTPAYPTRVVFQAQGVGGTAAIYKIDNVIFADNLIGTGATKVGASNSVNWTNGANTSKIYLYWQHIPLTGVPEPWQRLDVGNVATYSHLLTQPTNVVEENPPTALPTQQPAEVRIAVGGQGSSQTLIYGPAVPCVLNNGSWEDVLLGTVELPPVATPEGAASPLWTYYLQGKCPGSNTPTIDSDCFWNMPADEDSITIKAQTVLTSQVKWSLDINRWGQVSCALYSKADNSLVDMASVIGQYTLGVGADIIGFQLETGDGSGNLVSDVVDLKCTILPTYVARYKYLRGAA